MGQALANCSHIIRDALQEIQHLFQTPEGRAKVSTDFKQVTVLIKFLLFNLNYVILHYR